MSNFKLQLKIKVASPAKISKTNTIKVEQTNINGIVIIEDGIYKVNVPYKDSNTNTTKNINLLFTNESYNLKGKLVVFNKITKHSDKIIRHVRNIDKAKFFPGDPNKYVPFAPNWVVKGNIIRDNNILKFEFIELITINGYNMIIE